MPPPRDILERLIWLANRLSEPVIESLSNAKEIENLSLLDPAGLPPTQLGMPVYSGPNLAVSAFNSALECGLEKACRLEFNQLCLGLRQDAGLLATVNSLADAEIKEPAHAEQKLVKKVLALVQLRRQSVGALTTSLAPQTTQANSYEFRVYLGKFTTFKERYLEITTLYLNKGIAFDQLLEKLRLWTSTCTIPPPLPLIPDPEIMPIQFENYSDSVRNRTPGTEGYTLQDGPWEYRVTEDRMVAGKSKQIVGKLCKLGNHVEFASMMNAVRKRAHDICAIDVFIIHSQDNIAQRNWDKYDSAMRRLKEQWGSEEDWIQGLRDDCGSDSPLRFFERAI